MAALEGMMNFLEYRRHSCLGLSRCTVLPVGFDAPVFSQLCFAVVALGYWCLEFERVTALGAVTQIFVKFCSYLNLSLPLI